MTFDDRVGAVAELGFTPRQAGFLTTVMLHAGLCLPRHYTQYCGIKWGHNARDFFTGLITREFATAHKCWRRGGTFYHVHHKGLYRAIGEPDNRHRRRVTIPRAVERLMLLDVVLRHSDVRWLATEREKVDYFTRERQCQAADLPCVVFGEPACQTIRYFTEKLPIGRGSRLDEVVFVHLVTSPEPARFERFISTYARLFRSLRCWTLRLVFPRFLASCQPRLERATELLFARPLTLREAEDFRWFCECRRAVELGHPKPTDYDEGRYVRTRDVYSAPRFFHAYRAWLQRGDGSLNHLLSPHLREAFSRGDVRVVSELLNDRYLDLARTVMTA